MESLVSMEKLNNLNVFRSINLRSESITTATDTLDLSYIHTHTLSQSISLHLTNTHTHTHTHTDTDWMQVMVGGAHLRRRNIAGKGLL